MEFRFGVGTTWLPLAMGTNGASTVLAVDAVCSCFLGSPTETRPLLTVAAASAFVNCLMLRSSSILRSIAEESGSLNPNGSASVELVPFKDKNSLSCRMSLFTCLAFAPLTTVRCMLPLLDISSDEDGVSSGTSSDVVTLMSSSSDELRIGRVIICLRGGELTDPSTTRGPVRPGGGVNSTGSIEAVGTFSVTGVITEVPLAREA